MKLKSVMLATVASAMLASPLVIAADWSQYRGPSGDGKTTDSIDAATLKPGSFDVVWKVDCPLGFSSFSIADGKAFTIIAENETEIAVALSAQTGQEIWRYPMGSSKYEHGGGGAGARDNKGGDGPRSTPSAAGKSVYVYDSYMVLHCLDAQSGKLVWKRDIVNEFDGREIKWHNATSPIIDGDLVYVTGGGAGQSFLAFNRTNGELLWKSGDETITHATPTLTTIEGKKQFINFVQFGLVSIDATTGKELWRTEFPFSVSTAASPVVSGTKVYASAGYGVGAGLFDVKNNSAVKEDWFFANELMNHWSTPVIHDGHLYGLFEFKKYGKAPLQCVELATGEIKWKEYGFGPGNCILVGDKLVVLSDAGEVAIVAAQSDAYHEITRADVLDGKCWSTPAYSDGKIYVRSTKEAACIAVD